MHILVEFSHPAQVHKFKHALRRLMTGGHEVLILSRDKDVMLELLDAEGLPHVCISKARTRLLSMGIELLLREVRALWHCFLFRPDVVLSAHSVAITHSGWLFRVPRIVHDDTEHAKLQHFLQMPFATHILTTNAYLKDWGPRQIRIKSLEPLAYLHPNHFTPDPGILAAYGLSQDQPYAVFRLIAWQAAHDVRVDAKGATRLRPMLIERLLKAGARRIVVTSEIHYLSDRPEIVRVRPEHLHDVLAFARLCVTEGHSVANEAAVLGVPTLYVNPLVSGLSRELERYQLIEHVSDFKQAIERAVAIWADKDAPVRWHARRENLLEENEDMSEAIAGLILSLDPSATSAAPASRRNDDSAKSGRV